MGLDQQSFYPLMFAFLLFFVGFNFLEAVQPSLVAKYANVNIKGTAMGVYSTSQFFGIFVGGAIGGLVLQKWGMASVFFFNTMMAGLLLFVAISLPRPDYYKSHLIKLKNNYLNEPGKTQQDLLAIKGVKQAAISPEEGVAYLKIDKNEFNEGKIAEFMV